MKLIFLLFCTVCLLIISSLFAPTRLSAQTEDSVVLRRPILSSDSLQAISRQNNKIYKFSLRQTMLPVVLTGLGVVGLGSDWMEDQNKDLRNELQEHIKERVRVDDILQYVPSITVYGLNLCGLKGKHNFRDRTILLASSYLMMGIAVNTLKYTTRVTRPDLSSRNSFPSGHTATAFMGAEFLWREYHEVSPWIGASGYLVATTTGVLRMYNNRHWFTDVIAGAGIGLLSAKAGYWLCRSIRKWVYGNGKHHDSSVTPFA